MVWRTLSRSNQTQLKKHQEDLKRKLTKDLRLFDKKKQTSANELGKI